MTQKGISINDTARWECQECDAVGPRVTEENHLKILDEVRKKMINMGIVGVITMADKPADKTNAEWVCALHAVVKHRKHEKVEIHVKRAINVSAEAVEKILADRAASEQNNTN